MKVVFMGNSMVVLYATAKILSPSRLGGEGAYIYTLFLS